MQIEASFDDASIEDIWLAELMERYDIPTIFYWPVMWQDYAFSKGFEALTDEQAKDIAKRHEIGSHTITHPLLTRIDLLTAQTEIRQSRQLLQEKFDQPINSFCYPRGYYTQDIVQLVDDAGYTTARTTQVGVTDDDTEKAFPLLTPTTLHIGCNRKEYGGLSWVEYGRQKVAEAKNADGIFRLWGHGWEITRNKAWDDVEHFLREILCVSV